MASLITIKLNKNAGSSWGFRLQGGKDFATPLCIQKVNVGSVASQAGLQAGDAIVSIGNRDALSLRHKEAQDAIVTAGNNFDMVVQRGSQIWKPAVAPLPEKIISDGVTVVTKTSLASSQKPARYIGSNHNCVPRPFPGAFNSSASLASPFKTITTPNSESAEKSPSFSNGIRSPTNMTETNKSHSLDNRNASTYPFSIEDVTQDLTISGTDITLDKEKAKSFLIMTLDKENNVNSPNLNQYLSKEHLNNAKLNGNSLRSNGFPGTSRSPSTSSVGSSNSFVGRGLRKHSFGSNCSSISSISSHDGDNDPNNHYQKDIVNTQYNSPVNIYSEDSIAETLSAQAEVLGKGGVLGVNFMKNDKSYDGRSSDVLRMVHEMDKEPQFESPGTPTNLLGSPDRPVVQGYSFKLLQRALTYEAATPPPQNFLSGQSEPEAPSGTLQPGENICFACQTLITGVFVRIKNKNLHADCFKCSTCGSSLKNVGYYNINERLYCDVHAKQAARSNPPAPNFEPVTVQPGVAPPVGAVTAPQASRMKVPAAFQHGGPAPVPAPAPQPEVPQPVVQEVPAPQPEPVFEPTPVPMAVPEVPSQPSSQFVEEEGVQSPPLLNGGTTEERAPAPAPAPIKPFAPAPAPAPAPVAAAPMKPAPAPAYSTSANPQGFGAPAGDINVRSHIPKKGDVPAPMTFAPVSAPIPAPAPVPLQIPNPTSNFGANTMPRPVPPPGMGGKIGPGGPPARGVPQAPGHRSAPRRGRGVMNQASASRIPVCNVCQRQIRGPFVSALGKTWCPDHFICATSTCKRNIIDMGFVEEQGALYCEVCYENFLAPICGKCDKRIKGDCLNAVGKQFHPECFCCAYCGKVFGSGAFYLEDGLPYCETDWNDLFTTKCVGCNFPIEAGDRWVEALNNNYHSQCFKCSKCHKNLEGQSFFAKGGKPFCKAHAQRGF